MFLNSLLLLTGFVVLILGANWLVSGASSLARRLKLSEMMIGLTIVAFGTSTPELVVNLIASFNGQDDVIFGNVIGSNIFNLLLILGISGTILPIVVHHKTVWREIPFAFAVILVLLLLVNTGKEVAGPVLGRWEGALLLSLFIVFTLYILRNIKTDGKGCVRFTPVTSGRYTLRTSVEEPTPGREGDQDYALIRHNCTLIMQLPLEK